MHLQKSCWRGSLGNLWPGPIPATSPTGGLVQWENGSNFVAHLALEGRCATTCNGGRHASMEHPKTQREHSSRWCLQKNKTLLNYLYQPRKNYPANHGQTMVSILHISYARSCRALKARDLCLKSTVAQWMLNKRVLRFISFFCGPVLVKKACYGANAKPASFSIALKLDGCLDSTTIESLSKWYDHFNTQPCSLWVLWDLTTRQIIRWSLVSYQQVNFGHFLSMSLRGFSQGTKAWYTDL